MCIVVDANVAGELANRSKDAAPVIKWLLTGGGKIIIGGRLTDELSKGGLADIIRVLNQAGKVVRVSKDKIDELSEKLTKENKIKSDDPHVVALMRLAKCKLIYTKDRKLHKDVKNLDLVGVDVSVYKSRVHAHLLRPCVCAE